MWRDWFDFVKETTTSTNGFVQLRYKNGNSGGVFLGNERSDISLGTINLENANCRKRMQNLPLHDGRPENIILRAPIAVYRK